MLGRNIFAARAAARNDTPDRIGAPLRGRSVSPRSYAPECHSGVAHNNTASRWTMLRGRPRVRDSTITEVRFQLVRSDNDRAWIIRFEQNPNKCIATANLRPMIEYLQSQGFQDGYDNADGEYGWGKAWTEGHYTFDEHIAAQHVLRRVAEIIEAGIAQGRRSI